MKHLLILALAASTIFAVADEKSASANVGKIVRGNSFAHWDGDGISVGNARFTAQFRVSGGILRTVYLKSVDGRERLRGITTACDVFSVAEVKEMWSAAGERELAVAVTSGDRTSVIRVWPRASGPMIEQEPAKPLPQQPGEREWGSKVFSFGWKKLDSLGAYGDALTFAADHLTVRAYTPIDRTDLRSELMDVKEFQMPTCEAMTYLRCGVLDVLDVLSETGVVFLRLAPMPISRTDSKVVDFALNPSSRGVMAVPNGYPLAMLAYEGGQIGRIRALRDFHRSLWPCLSGRDGVLLSNTWGDGNRDSRINEDFLMKEIAAGADIGVEVIQLDDGWQKGRSANSSQSKGKGVWNGYWATDPEFWTSDPERFPHGLGPLADAARANGMSLGLWFGPDSSDDAKNWERDADCLIGFFRTLNIRHFKIDSLKLHTPEAYRRNRRFFEKMIGESNREMCFDLDCTAEVRPGFLGGMPVGQLFVENRYAHRPGDKRIYYPHQTLRSLWSLAHVLDPVRMRMEFLNPAKKDDKYGNDPLRPAAWPEDALFAITMTASPLAWMELSDVPERIRAKWRPLIAAWKRERPRMHEGLAVPVGGKPDGVAWTGFVTVCNHGGYALLFREMNAEAKWRLELKPYFSKAPLSATVLAGDGRAAINGDVLSVEVPSRLGYVWLRLD